MIEIPDQTIEEVLSMYKPDDRFLKKARVSYPVAEADFMVGQCEYIYGDITHVTASEMIKCLNQMGYVFFGNEILNGRWPNIGFLDFPEFLRMRDNYVFINNINMRMKRQIKPHEVFSGRMEVGKVRDVKGTYFVPVDFSLGDGASKGDLLVCLANPA